MIPKRLFVQNLRLVILILVRHEHFNHQRLPPWWEQLWQVHVLNGSLTLISHLNKLVNHEPIIIINLVQILILPVFHSLHVHLRHLINNPKKEDVSGLAKKLLKVSMV